MGPGRLGRKHVGHFREGSPASSLIKFASGMKYQRGGAGKSATIERELPAVAEGEGALQMLERTPKYHRGLGGVQSACSLAVKSVGLSRRGRSLPVL